MLFFLTWVQPSGTGGTVGWLQSWLQEYALRFQLLKLAEVY